MPTNWKQILTDYVDTLEAAVGAIEGATTLHNKLTAARAALLDQITAVRLAELDAANLPADIDTLLTRLSALRAGYLDELAAANIPADVDTLLARLTALRAGYLDELDFDLNARLGLPAGASISADLLTIDNLVDDLETRLTAARGGYLDNLNTGVPVNSRTAAYTRLVGVKNIIEVSITSAANAGLVTVATVTTQPCLIKSVVIHADAAQTADMTTCAVTGGVGQVVTFVGTGDATQANLNAADKQVAWTGAVRLAATKLIQINLLGTGVTAVDLTITIEYEACVDAGYLA